MKRTWTNCGNYSVKSIRHQHSWIQEAAKQVHSFSTVLSVTMKTMWATLSWWLAGHEHWQNPQRRHIPCSQELQWDDRHQSLLIFQIIQTLHTENTHREKAASCIIVSKSPMNCDWNQRRLRIFELSGVLAIIKWRYSHCAVKHLTIFENSICIGNYNLSCIFHAYMCYSKITFY